VDIEAQSEILLGVSLEQLAQLVSGEFKDGTVSVPLTGQVGPINKQPLTFGEHKLGDYGVASVSDCSCGRAETHYVVTLARVE